jgi:hypothetical protein
MLRRGEIPRANAELYLVTVTPHESIALYRLPARRSSAQRHECARNGSSGTHTWPCAGKRATYRPSCGRTGGGMGKPAPRLVRSDWTGSSV